MLLVLFLLLSCLAGPAQETGINQFHLDPRLCAHVGHPGWSFPQLPIIPMGRPYGDSFLLGKKDPLQNSTLVCNKAPLGTGEPA